MRSSILGAPALALAAAACGSGQERVAASDQPASGQTVFAPAEGWNAVTEIAAVGEETSPVAWAATVPFRPDEGAAFPDATVAGLAYREIVMSALGSRPFAGDADFPQLADAPLVIGSEECISRAYDGQPAPHITFCHLDRWVGEDRILNVDVWLGAAGPMQIPDEEQLEKANEQLGRLVIDD